MPVTFTYDFTTSPTISNIRLLIADTDPANPIFGDDEINAFISITSGVWQSSMFYSGAGGQATLPSSPVNLLRSAALALDSLAANKSRLSSVIQLLDVKLSPDKAAIQLRATAAEYRQVDDDSMAFVIIEQVHNDWTFRDRFWSQWQRNGAQ